MWTNGKTAGASQRILNHLQHCCVQSVLGRGTEGWQRRLCRSSSGPPWRLLFFGSDQFAVESLKRLTSSRCESYTRGPQHTFQCVVTQILHTNDIAGHTALYYTTCPCELQSEILYSWITEHPNLNTKIIDFKRINIVLTLWKTKLPYQ